MLFKIYESLTGGKSKGWDHWLQEVKLKYMFLSVSISFPAATSALSVAVRSYPMSEVRGRSREDPMPEGRRPRGATPRPRLGQQPRVPGCDCAGMAEKSYSSRRSGAAARRSYPTPEARGRGREDQPHVQGAVAARAQEGLEELSHIEGQKGRR